ncbi:hypothetical protein BLOT_003273 [Blomia tropicalis]|nr:hypothetical protein BLOT_003273 [Blomia tropicalis]
MRAISANNNHGTVKDVPYEKKTLICLPSGWRSRESRSQSHILTTKTGNSNNKRMCDIERSMPTLRSNNNDKNGSSH